MEARQQFLELRTFVFNKIKQSLDEDGGCKSYEGSMRIIEQYPDYFEVGDGQMYPTYQIELDCYVYGPSRHYTWSGKTLLEAVQKADAEIKSWSEKHG